MRMLILGAGALGGYFGGKLLQSGASVDFLVRPRRAAQLVEHGLVIRDASGESVARVVPKLAGEVRDHYDVVLLACKSYDLPSAIDAIEPAVGPETAILPLLNGIRHVETLAQRFGANRVLGGVTVVYVSMTPDGVIERGAALFDGTRIGEMNGAASSRCNEIASALSTAGLATVVSENIVADLWLKFFGFNAMATITTLIRARAGEIAAAPEGARYVASVVDEISNVFARAGYPPTSDTVETIGKVFAQTGSTYGPSILRDVEAGRATEGADTVGDLVRRADRMGVEVPLCRAALCHLQVQDLRRAQAGGP